jgi:hypothetical protein
MIFYHFAFLKTVDGRYEFMRRHGDDGETITFEPAPEGLVPDRGKGWGSCEIIGGPEVVWLTTDATTVPDSCIWKMHDQDPVNRPEVDQLAEVA